MTDGELARQAQAGRREAYGELARRWAGRLMGFCHARVGRADAAEELAQETIVRGWSSLAALEDPDRIGSWLHGIALRASIDYLRSRARRQIPFSVLAGDQDTDDALSGGGASAVSAEAHDPLEGIEERDRLLAHVEALPEELRTVLMLYYYDDVTYADLALVLGVSPATVNARLTRARALLRRRLAASERRRQ